MPTAPFIGKEKDNESYLGDFGVRKFDDGIGRFTSIDPLWEKYYSWTPYHYCRNNPVNRIDPTGLVDFIYNQDGEKIGEDNDWGIFDFLHTDSYYVEFKDGSRIEANSQSTVEETNWNHVWRNWDSHCSGLMLQFWWVMGDYEQNGGDPMLFAILNSREGGLMDRKHNLVLLDDHPNSVEQSMLYEFDGKLYNWREAGNVVWGAMMHQLKIDRLTMNAGAQGYSILFNGEEDDANEVDAFNAGYSNGYKYIFGSLKPWEWDTTDW